MKPLPILKRGGTIGVVAPSKPLEKEGFEKIKEAFSAFDYQVLPFCFEGEKVRYLSASDKLRVHSLERAFFDEEVDAVWAHAGGFGAARLLPYLAKQKRTWPVKPFIGMSDVTALHHFFPFPTYLGPNLGFLSERPTLLEKTVAFLAEPKRLSFPYPVMGGNLALLASLCGTPFQPRAKERYLLLEDVNEPPYKIDRMLNQLKQSLVFEGMKGVILGGFTGEHSLEPQFSPFLDEILEEYFPKIPKIKDFPSGHKEEQVTVPIDFP